MGLTSEYERTELGYKRQQRHRDGQRKYVLYCADKVNLAVFHKRPAHEIDQLMEALKAATRKDN